MTPKILLAITCPRDNIEESKAFYPKLPCDLLLLKFFEEYKAYRLMRQYFLYEEDWTHLVIGSDDLIIKPENVQSLLETLERQPHIIVSGVCNIDETDFDLLNITPPDELPSAITPYAERKFNFIHRATIEDGNSEHYLMRVGFCGFPLMAIPRNIIEKIQFETDAELLGHPIERGQSTDLLFCQACHDSNIPIFADTTNQMRHLRYAGTSQVGFKEPIVELIRQPKY